MDERCYNEYKSYNNRVKLGKKKRSVGKLISLAVIPVICLFVIPDIPGVEEKKGLLYLIKEAITNVCIVV